MTKLNNKGQTLALFVIIIPVIILISIYVVDLGICKYNENKLNNINYLVIDDVLNDLENVEDEKITKLIKENYKDEVNINIKKENNEIKIKLEKDINGAFGTIIGKKLYKIKSFYKGYLLNDKKVIERID